MNSKDKIAELIQNSGYVGNTGNLYTDIGFCSEQLADLLVENNVMKLPCKIGDTVYRISVQATTKVKYIQKTTISRIAIDNEGVWLFCSCNPISRSVFGKNIFLTKEEAEASIERWYRK